MQKSQKQPKNMYNCIADEPNIIINSSKTTKAETKNIRHFQAAEGNICEV